MEITEDERRKTKDKRRDNYFKVHHQHLVQGAESAQVRVFFFVIFFAIVDFFFFFSPPPPAPLPPLPRNLLPRI